MIIVLFIIGVESGGTLFSGSSSEAFLLNDDAKIRLFSDTTKFRVAIRADFQQPLIQISLIKLTRILARKNT